MFNKFSFPKIVLFIGLAVFTNFNLFASQLNQITGDVSLNLKEETISAKLKYDYLATVENEKQIKFFLNETFSVSRVKCSICESYSFDVTARPPTLTVQLKRAPARNERLKIEIDYSGKLTEMYNREHRFLELGLDFFWIPYDSKTSAFVFNYRLNLNTDVPDFQMVTNGKTTKKGKNWLIESKTPDFDINVIMAPTLNFKSYREKGYNLQVVSKNMPDEVANDLLKGMVETLDFYNSTFGRNNPQHEITAVFRPFQLDLGYFRKGYFILPTPKKAEDLFFTISHELAHYWWLKADQQNAWLNESFAEYSAMLALRKLRGMEKFEAILERKKKQNTNLPAVYGFDRTKNRQQTPMVLYVKGALKLYELEKDLGEESFLQFLQKVADERINETDQLIEHLKKFSSPEMADKFLANLKN